MEHVLNPKLAEMNAASDVKLARLVAGAAADLSEEQTALMKTVLRSFIHQMNRFQLDDAPLQQVADAMVDVFVSMTGEYMARTIPVGTHPTAIQQWVQGCIDDYTSGLIMVVNGHYHAGLAMPGDQPQGSGPTGH